MREDRKTVVYFIPHQDDELLTFGVAICKTVKKYRVVVVLCTDGSNSYVRSVLSNQHRCNKHFGKHIYNLTKEEFVLARDKEFMSSCRRLGIDQENIIIPPSRVEDGELSIDSATKIIESFFSENGTEVFAICSMHPLSQEIQHADHANLGTAVIQMGEKYNIIVKSFVEPYCIKSIVNGEVFCREEQPTVLERVKLALALYSYKVWKPAKSRFAVGYHSVTNEFIDFNREPRSYCCTKKNI